MDVFDRHRVGDVDNRRCLDPHTARTPDGQPMFTAVTGPFGITWKRWRPAAHGWFDDLKEETA